eukprot:5154837-Pyramimonas_sp.AAC.1
MVLLAVMLLPTFPPPAQPGVGERHLGLGMAAEMPVMIRVRQVEAEVVALLRVLALRRRPSR